jgi:hypothetical protein
MAEQDTMNTTGMNGDHFPVRIQIATGHRYNNLAEHQEVVKLRVVNSVHQFYRELENRCRTTIKEGSINGCWAMEHKIRDVAVIWAGGPTKSGGSITLIHDRNVEGVLELLQLRKGVDTVSIAVCHPDFLTTGL